MVNCTDPYKYSTTFSGPFDNNTVSTNTSSITDCGVSPATITSGFRAGACGDKFDRILNDTLGYRENPCYSMTPESSPSQTVDDAADRSLSPKDLAPRLTDNDISDCLNDKLIGGV